MKTAIPKTPRYKIKIRLSETTLLDYNSCCAQDKIFWNPQRKAHTLVLLSNYVSNSTGLPEATLINIPQN